MLTHKPGHSLVDTTACALTTQTHESRIPAVSPDVTRTGAQAYSRLQQHVQ
eukprot:gene1486-4644_t